MSAIITLPATQWEFQALLRSEVDGPVLARETALPDDFNEARGETWLTDFLAAGRRDTSFDDLSLSLHPTFLNNDPGAAIEGFELEAVDPSGHTARRTFPAKSLSHVASRGQKKLLADNNKKPEDSLSLHYEVRAVKKPVSPSVSDEEALLASMVTRSAPPVFLRVPIQPLLDTCTMIGQDDQQSALPIFYVLEAHKRSEQASRRGAKQRPPVETGAVLLSVLCCCPDSGRIFQVIVDALAINDTLNMEHSLTYSSRTWGQVLSIVKARQAACPAIVMGGQSHGHNFDAGTPCADCKSRAECTKTTVFLSSDDIEWHRAVFGGRSPWAIAQIFGSNARAEPQQGVFALKEGRMKSCGFRVIESFDPQAWPVLDM